MKYTENYNLKKPEQTDSYNVDDFNENADAIDAKLKELLEHLTVEDISSDFLANDSTENLLAISRIYVFKQGNVITGNIAFHGDFASASSADCYWTINEKYKPLQTLINMPTDTYNVETGDYTDRTSATIVYLYNRSIKLRTSKEGTVTVEATFSYICE